jgi:hypothetical protein
MERRNKSLRALSELNYIDSLDSYEKADAIVKWYEEYLGNSKIEEFDLEFQDLKRLEELMFKNINFLKEQKEIASSELINIKKMRRFLKI